MLVELFIMATWWLLRQIMKLVSFIKTPYLTTFPDIAPENTVVKVAKSATTKAPDPAFDIRNMFVDTVMYQSIFAPAKDNPRESI